MLSGAEIAGNGNLPSLVFFNACEAGRVRKAQERGEEDLDIARRIERNVGLAGAFLRGGVANYIGTYWPVGDDAALEFAGTFYRELLLGVNMGNALLAGRRKIEALESVDWADYIHYGNQSFVLKIPHSLHIPG